VVGYDPHEQQVGGLLHALLPWQRPGEANPAKFVDSGIPLLVRKMESLGAKRAAIVWRVVGGAEMLGSPAGPAAFRIGAQNVSAAQTVMQQEGLTIRASDLGGSVGRTVKLRMRDGAVIVRTLGQGEKVLA
jgi:chemotaxis protein CheD